MHGDRHGGGQVPYGGAFALAARTPRGVEDAGRLFATLLGRSSPEEGDLQTMLEIVALHPSLACQSDPISGATALHRVVEGNPDPRMVQRLLEMRADPGARDHEGLSPLFYAVAALGRALKAAAQAPRAMPRHTDGEHRIVRILVFAGQEVVDAERLFPPGAGTDADEQARRSVEEAMQFSRDCRDELNLFKSSLWGHAESGEYQQARDLIARTDLAPVDAADDDHGANSLLLASLHSHAHMVEVLLQEGANPDFCDHEGRSALHLLCEPFDHRVDESRKSANEHERARCAELLLQHGANINLPDSDGYQPLHFACLNYQQPGMQDMIIGLLKNGARFSAAAHLADGEAVRSVATPAVQVEAQLAERLRDSPPELLSAANSAHAEFAAAEHASIMQMEIEGESAGHSNVTRLGATLGMPPVRQSMWPVVPFRQAQATPEVVVEDKHESSDEEEEVQAIKFSERVDTTEDTEDDEPEDLLSKDWAELSPEECSAAILLGYNADEWPTHQNDGSDDSDEDSEGTAAGGCEGWPEWSNLGGAQRDAARVLGLSEDSWPPTPPLFFSSGDARDKSWDELEPEEQASATTLGWCDKDFGDTSAGTTRYLPTYALLTDEQQSAVQELGIEEQDWDQMNYADPDDPQWEPEPEMGGIVTDPDKLLRESSADKWNIDPDNDAYKLSKTYSVKRMVQGAFRLIDESNIFARRADEIESAKAEFSMSTSCAAAVMKKFQWNFMSARAKFRACDDDPFEFAKAMGLTYDITEGTVRSDGSEEIECPVFFVDTTEWTALSCGCKFSNEAWEHYIQTAITSGDRTSGEATGLTCQTRGCNIPVPEEMMIEFAGKHRDKYRRFVANSWVAEQRDLGLLKFCPFPDCGHVADARKVTAIDLKTKPAIVKCLCNNKFCFLCQAEAHAPAGCEEFKEWNHRFETDPMTQQYLAAFCKPCPTAFDLEKWKDKLWKTQGLKVDSITDASHPRQHGCGSMIFKDGGCNHIWSCKCDFHWCWQCGGPYFATVVDKKGVKRQYHTGGWYNCNNVDQSAVESSAQAEQDKLKRWQRISDCYATAVQSEKPATRAKIQKRVEELSQAMLLDTKTFTQGNVEELQKAMLTLFECRRMVKFFYVRQYTYEMAVQEGKVGAVEEKTKFDLWMNPFTHAVDQVSQMIENPEALDQLRKKKHREHMAKLCQTMKSQCELVEDSSATPELVSSASPQKK